MIAPTLQCVQVVPVYGICEDEEDDVDVLGRPVITNVLTWARRLGVVKPSSSPPWIRITLSTSSASCENDMHCLASWYSISFVTQKSTTSAIYGREQIILNQNGYGLMVSAMMMAMVQWMVMMARVVTIIMAIV